MNPRGPFLNQQCNIETLTKALYSKMRPSPIKQNSNHNQFISYAQLHQNPPKIVNQGTGISEKLTLEQRHSERSGSDYVKQSNKIQQEELKRMSSTFSKFQSVSPKTGIKSVDFRMLDIHSQKKSLTPQSAISSPKGNDAKPTSSYLQRRFTLYLQKSSQQASSFRKSQSTKNTQILTEPSQTAKGGTERDSRIDPSVRIFSASKQLSRPASSSKIEPKRSSYKRKAQTPQQNGQEQLNVHLSLQQYRQKLNMNDTTTYAVKVPMPLTTRPNTTVSQVAGQFPQSTKNTSSNGNIQEHLKSYQFQQQLTSTLSHLQKLNSQLQEQRMKSKDNPKPIKQAEEQKQPTQEPNLLIQFVTQVQMGQLNPVPGSHQQKDKNLDQKQKDLQQQHTIKLLESMKERQKQKKVGDKSKDSIPQMRYYMTKMNIYQREECENDQFAQLFRDHFVQSFHALGFCSVLSRPTHSTIAGKAVKLKRRPTLFNKTIVLDLDETLIHCNENTQIPADVILPIEFPNGELIHAGVNIRPYADHLLSQLTSLCEVIVFTASHSCYANKVIDYLDPTGKLIHHRLFRESCVTTDEVLSIFNRLKGVHIKDLSIFSERDLKDVVLVDNAAYSFGYQLDNGIPIIPFYDNKKDTELLDLLEYLKQLLSVPDVRVVNRKHFKMHLYSQHDTIDDAIQNVCQL